MQVVLHAGAHMTDEDRIVSCLLRNRDALRRIGTEVPGPGLYRRMIRVILRTAARTAVGPRSRAEILEATEVAPDTRRLVLSAPSFFGTPKMAAAGGTLYASSETRIGYFHQIFGGDRLELFIGIRNLASFLPATFATTKFDSMAEFLRGTDPAAMRWSDLVHRLRASYPHMPITVWCNEDTPLIWSEVLREMAGLDQSAPLEAEFALLEEIMTPAGLQRFQGYMADRPGMGEAQKRQVIAAFLDKFADEEAIEEELDAPGWTEDLVAQMTRLYDEDVLAIGTIPGVNLITP